MPDKKDDSKKEKICFVIAPIGKEGTETRRRSDQIFNSIIAPVVSELGFTPIRADKISEPGMITNQIIQQLINDDLVIADLTDHNPNVFYELGIRHAVRKAIIQIIEEGQDIPFDISQVRTIPINRQDLGGVEKSKKELSAKLRALISNPDNIESPVSHAMDLRVLNEKGISQSQPRLMQDGESINEKDQKTGLFQSSFRFRSKFGVVRDIQIKMTFKDIIERTTYKIAGVIVEDSGGHWYKAPDNKGFVFYISALRAENDLIIDVFSQRPLQSPQIELKP